MLEGDATARAGGGPRFAAPALVLLALLGRLPFVSAGFGTDTDAWRVGLAAQYMHATGLYGSSRVPGHPVQDGLVAHLVTLGPAGINGATALLSVLAVYLFYRWARRLAVPHPFGLGLAFAFLPLVYLHSVDALDYLWALAFLLVAVELVDAERFVFAGVALGLATGCRITSLAMLAPLVVLCPPGLRLRGLVRMGLAAALVAALCYVPVILTYGFQYLRFTPTPYPRAAYIAKELTFDVCGVLGLLGVALALARQGLAGAPRRGRAPEAWRRLRLAGALALACYGAIFLRLPDDAGYLLPVVPFALLALATVLTPRRLAFAIALLVASSFVLKVRIVGKLGAPPPAAMSLRLSRGLALELPGAIFADHARRVSESAYADAVLRASAGLPPGSALFVADWYPILAYKGAGPAVYQYPKPAQLDSLRNERVFYLPDTDRDVLGKTGVDLHAYGAREFDLAPSARTGAPTASPTPRK